MLVHSALLSVTLKKKESANSSGKTKKKSATSSNIASFLPSFPPLPPPPQQLYARCAPRPQLGRLGWSPLERPLSAGDILELEGPPGSGKTELLLEALLNCVLPRAVPGGMESAAVYIATDARWCRRRVAERLQERLGVHRQNGGEGADPGAPDDAVVQQCLSRLVVVRCHSARELLAALARVQHACNVGSGALLGDAAGEAAEEPPPVRLLAVDTINAFYWQERSRPSASLAGAAGAAIAVAATAATAATPSSGSASAGGTQPAEGASSPTSPAATTAVVVQPTTPGTLPVTPGGGRAPPLRPPPPMDAVVCLLRRIAADGMVAVLAAVRTAKADGVRSHVGKGWAAARTRHVALAPAAAPAGAWAACHFAEVGKGRPVRRAGTPGSGSLCIFSATGACFS